MKVTVAIGEGVRTARISRRGDEIHVAFEDGLEATLRAERGSDGGFTLRAGAGLRRAYVHADGEERHLWVDGRTVRYRRIEPGVAREAHGSDSLAATIPAVVLDVLVSAGEAVEEGQTLVLLESMKMVMPIVAPRAGTVSVLRCAKGDSVAPGAPLVELAAEGDAGDTVGSAGSAAGTGAEPR